MSNLQRYEPEVIDAEIISLELAPVEAKHELATRAYQSLPLQHQSAENFATLQQAITSDPRGFLELCKSEGLYVDFDLVINYHHTEHHHHHAPETNALTREDIWEIAQAMQPQEPGLTAAEVMAIMQSYQPPQQPAYYPPPPINFNPHIEVSSSAHSHSEQDNDCGGGLPFVILAWVAACCLVLLVGGGK